MTNATNAITPYTGSEYMGDESDDVTIEAGILPPYCGFWRRAAGFVIDCMFFFAVAALIRDAGWALLSLALGEQYFAHLATYSDAFGMAAIFYTLGTFYGYFAIFEWLYGATPGKVLLRMRVVRRNGMACTLVGALLRGCTRIFELQFFGLPAAASMVPPLNMRLGDRLAQTIVVSTADPQLKQPRRWYRFVTAAFLYVLLTLGAFVGTLWAVA